jgi:hypothetical protein
MELISNKLVPANGKHLKNKDGQIFEGAIWLGIYDSKDNYVEVTEEEYQQWMEEQHEIQLNNN